MRTLSGLTVSVGIVLLLGGCVGSGTSAKQGLGTVAGAAAGGVAGSRIGAGKGKVAATVGGVVLGALLGSEVGRRLDENDRQAISRAEYQALESAGPNRPVAWQNPGSGHRGQVSAGPAYFVNEQNCRDYAHTVYIDGQSEILRGTACRNPDGTWRDVS